MKSDLPERTFEFARRVVLLCRFLEKRPGVSKTLANQLLRSGTSIGANVEEGQASQSESDFISKYSVACKEARETHYWLRLLWHPKSYREKECDELIAILISIVRKMRGKNK